MFGAKIWSKQIEHSVTTYGTTAAAGSSGGIGPASQYPGYTLGMYNTAECGWDGGDCCPSTCVSTSYGCGSRNYQCWDPSAGGSFPAGCNAQYDWYVGDGWCDSDPGYNVASCNWGPCATLEPTPPTLSRATPLPPHRHPAHSARAHTIRHPPSTRRRRRLLQ